MSIILKGIDLPNSGQIELVIRPHGKVWIETKGIGRAEAIQIPTPHGRLIDADVLQRDAYQKNFDGIIGEWELFHLNYYLVEQAQTILEAEGGDAK